MYLLVAVAALACVTLAFLWTVRHFGALPDHSRLKSEAVVMPVAVFFTGAFTLAVATVEMGAMRFPLSTVADLAIGTAAVVAVFVVSWVAFRLLAPRRPAPGARQQASRPPLGRAPLPGT
ncbi:hypothetical protein AB7M35_004317 [Amorphus suaedae]